MAEQEDQIRKDIVDQTPDQMKLSFVLWNALAVRAYNRQCFLIDMPIRSLRRYLNSWEFKPHRPLKRAFEQKPEGVKKSLETEYPAIAARTKSEGAEIYWGDETAAPFVEHYLRGYAPKGQTPVFTMSKSKREGINLISAVTNHGEIRFMLYMDSMTSKVLIRFVQLLIKDADRKVFLVMDKLRVHHSKVLQTWLEERRKQIEAFFLSSYSPELNPDEFMNGDLKMKMSTSKPTRGGEPTKKKVVSHLRSIQSQSHWVRPRW